MLVNDPKRGLVVRARIAIKVVECPIECMELRPAEIVVGSFVVFAILEQEVARPQKCLQTWLCGPHYWKDFRHVSLLEQGQSESRALVTRDTPSMTDRPHERRF